MKVKIKVPSAGYDADGQEFQRNVGEIADVEKVEAGRMIRAGHATAEDEKEGKAAVEASKAKGQPHLGLHRHPAKPHALAGAAVE